MLPIDNLSVIRITEAEPGTLLVCGAQRNRSPMLILSTEQVRYGVEFGERGPVMKRIEAGPYYISAGNPALLVDHSERIDLNNADFRPGLAFVSADACGLVVDFQQQALRYVTIAGDLVDEPSNLEALALFPTWKIVIPGSADETITVAQSGGYDINALA